MIYKLTFDDARIDWCTAKDQLHLLKSYDKYFDLSLQELESIDKISEEEAKTIMVSNTEFDEDNPDDMPEQLSIWELAVGDDFCIIASTEFD
jgi:ERCC4-type nuclease